jgi:hypothetical protein
MATRAAFAKKIATLELSHAERAIAFLWYYRQTQEFDERTASELANDLHDDGFPKPQVSKLHSALMRSRFTNKGKREKTFQIDLRRLQKLDEKYSDLLDTKKVEVSDSVIPNEWVAGTRVYLEKMVYQINGSFDSGFYDSCAVLCRRLMESLLIEIYVSQKRHHEIQDGRTFHRLEKIIGYASSDKSLTLGRNTPKTMLEVKQLGDTAAHDRVYITHETDITLIRARLRKMIQELLHAAGIA